MAAKIEEELLNERVKVLLENEPYEHPLKDDLTLNFERPKDLMASDIFSLLLKPASVFKTLEGHKSTVHCVAFSPDNKLIASTSDDNTVRLWNIPSGKLNAELKGHTNLYGQLLFLQMASRFSRQLGQHCSNLVDCGDKIVRMFDANTGHEEKRFEGHTNWVNSVVFFRDGKYIASGSEDNTVCLWNASSLFHIPHQPKEEKEEESRKRTKIDYK